MSRPYVNDELQDALNRMRRASERGTGCHLTREMIVGLSVSIVGQAWCEDDPRSAAPSTGGAGQ